MPVTQIIVVRHAHRNHWIVDTVDQTYRSAQQNPTGISTDPALTPHGISQSKQVASALLALLRTIPTSSNLAIFSSPFYRCLQTIAPTINCLRQHSHWRGQVHLEAGFSEWFGTAPFPHPAPLDAANIHERFFDFVHATYQSQASFPLGPEPYENLRKRTQVALEATIAQAESSSLKDEDVTLVIVAHTAVVIMLGRILTASWPADHSEEDFKCYLAGISTYRRSWVGNELSEWEMQANSDCSHLSDGAEGGWHFGKMGVQDERIVRGEGGHRVLTREYLLE